MLFLRNDARHSKSWFSEIVRCLLVQQFSMQTLWPWIECVFWVKAVQQLSANSNENSHLIFKSKTNWIHHIHQIHQKICDLSMWFDTPYAYRICLLCYRKQVLQRYKKKRNLIIFGSKPRCWNANVKNDVEICVASFERHRWANLQCFGCSTYMDMWIGTRMRKFAVGRTTEWT